MQATTCEKSIMPNSVFKITFKIQKFSKHKYHEFLLSVCLSVSFPQLWSPLFDLNENWLHSQSNNSFEIQSPAICFWCLWLLHGLNGTFHSIQKAENMSSWLVLPTHPQTSSRFFPIHHQLEVWRNFLKKREKKNV